MPKTKMFDNRVTIRYWSREYSMGDETGHISLKTYRGGPDGKGIEASFWPANECCLLSMNQVPTDFYELALPDKCHSCYVEVKGDGEALYYSDRTSKTIKKCLILEDKKDSFREILARIETGVPLKEESGQNVTSELEQVYSIVNHRPKRGVTLFDQTRKALYHTYGQDLNSYCTYDQNSKSYKRRYPDEIDLLTLDVDEINEAYRLFKEGTYDWSLMGDITSCSGLVAYLLVKGGIKETLKLSDKIETGAAIGGVVGGIAGGLTGVIIVSAAISSAVAVPPLIPLVGWLLVVIGGLIVMSIPAGVLGAMGVAGLSAAAIAAAAAAGITTGAMAGALIGAGLEYYYTEYRLGKKSLVTPYDVFKLASYAKEAEENTYGEYREELRLLEARCNRIIDCDKGVDIDKIDGLSFLLGKRLLLPEDINGENLNVEIYQYTSSYLEKQPFLKRSFSFFGNPTISIFKRTHHLIVDNRPTLEKICTCVKNDNIKWLQINKEIVSQYVNKFISGNGVREILKGPSTGLDESILGDYTLLALAVIYGAERTVRFLIKECQDDANFLFGRRRDYTALDLTHSIITSCDRAEIARQNIQIFLRQNGAITGAEQSQFLEGLCERIQKGELKEFRKSINYYKKAHNGVFNINQSVHIERWSCASFYLGVCSFLAVAIIYEQVGMVRMLCEEYGANIEFRFGRTSDYTALSYARSLSKWSLLYFRSAKLNSIISFLENLKSNGNIQKISAHDDRMASPARAGLFSASFKMDQPEPKPSISALPITLKH